MCRYDTVDVQSMNEKEIDKILISKALEVRKNAYVPYSRFAVGAALLTKDGKIYTGCNVENAAYTPTNCAERTAFFKAISEGDYKFTKIAVVGDKVGDVTRHTMPCAVCRQVMVEFCNTKTFKIITAINEEDYKEYSLEEILPYSFGPSDLEV